ncbi:3-oxoacyl-[acyl-carrier protein] reductase [Daejeonella rubra]|uniref:3-oxoacyl-[acyl-carrier protein] reductase n=1 Tax=Daejeonella rubra TaxID=990371 RepID=A0A1G9Q5N2_9SPHI|nr:SDR family oxidoreductase [Daejeonella rubra]SDM05665.1 3-oxoacyl-[acyl-carrier protein] reductase [Daejeonella rubra]
MNLDLTGKRALVCGSTQGIGKATAIELALLGANVTLLARNEEKLRLVLEELPIQKGQEHDLLIADFTDPTLLKSIIENYTTKNSVDILINNTGGPAGGQAIDAATEEFINAFNMHLICNQILVQAIVPGMKKNQFGRIINIISTSVKTPLKGLGVSNTIRGAVASWAKTLALELGPFGITVNNVLPGFTMTGRLEFLINSIAEKEGKSTEAVKNEMVSTIPAGRIADATEVAAAIAFLASPAASYINGINVPVDGGKTPSL